MHLLYNYNENIVKYDLINKFNYKYLSKIPKFKSLTLSFKLKRYDIKNLISGLAALEILTLQKPVLSYSKISTISLKIRKGQPVGCKITLRQKNFKRFLYLLINNLSLTQNKIENTKKNVSGSLTIRNILVFDILEKNYQFFKNLSDLNINLTTTDCNNKELIFLLKSNKFIL